MDATGQFFRALPNKSLAEVSKQCMCRKKSKESITCAFFVKRCSGRWRKTDCYRQVKKNCFASEQSGIRINYPAHSQAKAWMDLNILDDVLSKLNWKLARERRNVTQYFSTMPLLPLAILQIWNKANTITSRLSRFFSPNCPSRLQPLVLGIKYKLFKNTWNWCWHMSLPK